MDTCVDFAPEEFMVTDDFRVAKSALNSSEQDLVNSLISNNRIVIFSKTTCPYCESSKTLLNNRGVNFVTVELDQIKEGKQVQNVLGHITGAKTVPRIFIDGRCIGGNSDLNILNNSGALKDLLKDL